MTHRSFIIKLLSITIATGGLLAFLLIFKGFEGYGILSMASLAFFAGFTLATYFSATKAALSEDKNAFTRLVMVASFVKMLLAAGLVIGYHQLARPSNNLFLIPFFFTYIVFTVFETSLMSKLAKMKAR